LEPDSKIVEQIDKLENKVKLSNLLTGKKFADLELSVANLEQKLNEISVDFPKLKERAEEVEDLLNLINLGLVEFKKNFDELNSRFADFQKMPSEVGKKITSYENKLNSLDENVKKLSETLITLSTIKDDVNETLRRTILPDLEDLKTNSMKNKLEIEHIKRDLDTFSSVVKSFERTIELTNVDTLLKRFESFENKIINIQTQLENFRNSLHDISVFQQKVSDLNFLDAVNELKSNLKNNDTKINENQTKIEELGMRIDNLSSLVDTAFSGTKTDLNVVEELYNKVKEMYDEISREALELKSMHEKVNLPGSTPIDYSKLPTGASGTLNNINERIAALEKHHNELVDVLQKELKKLKSEISESSNTQNLTKKLVELERAMISRDRNLNEYKRQIEKRFKAVEIKKLGDLPKEITNELSSLKEITSRLLTENNEFRKLVRELRVSQMVSVKPETFASTADKINMLEKKISELEREKGSVTQLERPELAVFADKIGNLEKRMIEIEGIMGKEFVPQGQPENLENIKKEIESLKNILEEKESTIESKISKIEKKMKEESVVHPIILE